MPPTIAPRRRPLVSVVTPVLDRRETLDRALDSVAAQTYPDVEHIVVDGGSTDGTLDLLEARARAGGLRYVSRPDDGMYDAINTGLGMATGEVLAYLNSDDAYLPWSIEAAVEGLTAGADLVYGDLVRIDRYEGRPDHLAIQFYRPFDLAHYTHVAALAQPTVFWWRSVTDELGPLDDSYRLLGDCEYWLRAAAAGRRMSYLREVLAVQFDHAGTLRATQDERLREEQRRLRAQYREVAGPPPPAWRAHADRSLRWRASQLAFRRELARREPHRWRRFIAFLREHEVGHPAGGALRALLPERWRGPAATMLPVDQFERALDAANGTVPA